MSVKSLKQCMLRLYKPSKAHLGFIECYIYVENLYCIAYCKNS